MKIIPVDIESSAYQALQAEIGTVFNSSQWLKIYGNKLQVLGIFDKGGKLIGFFNLYHDKVFKLRHLSNPPYSPTISLCYQNPSKNNAKKHSFDKSVFKLIEEYLRGVQYDIVTLAFPPMHKDMQVFMWNEYKVIPNYTYRIYLNDESSMDDVIKGFSPERRNDVKKAIKDKVTCSLSNNYEVVKEMVKYTFDRKNEKLKITYIDDIFDKFSNRENSYSFISYQNGAAIAASFVVHDKHTAYYLLGGYNPSLKHQGAGALAVSKALEHAIKLNKKVFDFEGSMLPEVERFFRGFGGELQPVFTVNKAKLPIEMLLKLKDRMRF